MVFRTLRGELSLGDLALLYAAFQQACALRASFLQISASVFKTRSSSQSFSILVARAASRFAADSSARPGRAFRRHPLSKRQLSLSRQTSLALRDSELFVPKPSRAIVGPRRGQSTLVKLLCRFYDSGDWSITIDGTDLRRFAVDELRQNITVLFQQPVHYKPPPGKISARRSLQALRSGTSRGRRTKAAGADTLFAGFPTATKICSATVDKGVELSVGEWQRWRLREHSYGMRQI